MNREIQANQGRAKREKENRSSKILRSSISERRQESRYEDTISRWEDEALTRLSGLTSWMSEAVISREIYSLPENPAVDRGLLMTTKGRCVKSEWEQSFEEPLDGACRRQI
jgi:hypothetical protein